MIKRTEIYIYVEKYEFVLFFYKKESYRNNIANHSDVKTRNIQNVTLIRIALMLIQ